MEVSESYPGSQDLSQNQGEKGIPEKAALSLPGSTEASAKPQVPTERLRNQGEVSAAAQGWENKHLSSGPAKEEDAL